MIVSPKLLSLMNTNASDSNPQPSSTLGGMLSSLFRGGSGAPSTGGFGSRKLLGGALLAAGAAYLYNRNKNRNAGPATDFLGK